MTGRTISHYRVMETLGTGGMGVVYKAVDLKLGRAVALKFLNERLSRNHEAVLRLEREARAASALNDPGICTIYEIEEVDGEVFIAMELLEGESLSTALMAGRLPFPDTLEYALQIADALHAAHAKGICHRDIKPGNIFLVGGKRAKVLDFGLAKIDAADDAGEMADTQAPLSRPGTSAGTVAYMSPEQALGKPLDPRTDLFSFGLVLYEMATGKRVFTGPTASVYEAILNRNPTPPSSVVTGLPAAFDRVIEKALEKDVELRYQSAADMRADLRRIKAAQPSGQQPHPTEGTRRVGAGVAIAVAAVLLGMAAALTYRFAGRSTRPESRAFLTDARFTQITDRPGLESSASLSPDGASVAYASDASGNWDIYVQSVDGGTVKNLTADSTAEDTDPAFSPDGKQIAFRSERDGGGIFVTDLAGKARRISNFCHNPAWSPDQASIVCATERIDIPSTRLALSPLWVLDVATGNKRQLTTFDGVQPTWSPHGDRIAYWSYTPKVQIWTVPAAGGTPVAATTPALGSRDWNPVWSPDGRYLFFASGRGGTTSNLWRVPIDEKTGAVLGPLEAVTTPSSDAGFISFTRDGSRLAYVSQSFTRNFLKQRFDRPSEPPTALTAGAHVFRQLDLSPDGGRIVYASESKLYVMAADGTGQRLLTDTPNSRGPRWSPDGSRVAFYSPRSSGMAHIWTIKPDGSDLTQATNYTDSKRGVYYPVWSPDGRFITCTSVEGLTITVDLSQPLAQQKPEVLPPFPNAGMSFVAWRWSPDGSALAGWKLLPDGKSAGIAVYDPKTRTYRDVTSFGIYPTWLANRGRFLFAANSKLYVGDETSSAVQDSPTPDGFAFDFALSKDRRWLYYARDRREGDVWMITLPPSTPATTTR